MRTHAEIIADADGPHALARVIKPFLDAPQATIESRCRAWNLTGSIPGEYWPLLASLSVASLDELAHAAAARKGIPANDTTPETRAA